MRRLALLLFVAATGCATSSVPEGAPTYTSVKDRLADPTHFYIGPGSSTGEITAERYTHDGWVSGATPVTITHGELDGALDSTGKLAVSGFEVDVDPIDIPESVFGKPARLEDIRVVLAKPSTADVVWSGDDDAAATLTLALDLSWTLDVNGQASPLGAQHLPPIAISTTLTGAGDHVDAQLSLDATGTLWDWAGLLKLTEMKMSLDAGSTDEI